MSLAGLTEVLSGALPAPTASPKTVVGRTPARPGAHRGGRIAAVPLILVLHAGPTLAQVAWDQSCGDDNWHTCCNRGGGVFENNWDVGPGPNCPLPLPGENDHVDLSARTVRLDRSPATIRSLSNGSLTLVHGLTVGEFVNLTNLNFLGGFALDAGGDIIITQVLNWQNGVFRGREGARVAVNGSATISTIAIKRLDGRTMVFNAPVTWREPGEILLDNGAVIDNRVGFVAENSSFMRGNGGRFVNNEAFTKRSSGGSTQFFPTVAFENTSLGRIDVETGTLQLDGGGESRGGINVSRDATLHFNTGFGRSFTFFEDTLVGGDGFVVATGNGITVADEFTVAFPKLRLNGNLHGPGEFRAGTLEWLSGPMSGGSTVVVGPLSLTGNGIKTLSEGHQLESADPATWTLGDLNIVDTAAFTNSNAFTIQNNNLLIMRLQNSESRFNNVPGGTLLNKCPITRVLGPGVFQNLSILRVDAPTARFQMEAATFEQDGVVQVLAGDLVILGGGRSRFGTFEIGPGTHVDFAAGTPFRLTGARFDGGGSVRVIGGRTLEIEDEQGQTVQIADLEMNTPGAFITGGGTLDVLNSLTWKAGVMANAAGKTICRNTLNLDGADAKAIGGRNFRNEGQATWTGGDIFLNGAGVFENAAGATLEIETDSDFGHNSGDPGVINNDGVIRKSSVGGLTVFSAGVVFNNRDSLIVSAGNIQINSSGASSGLFAIAEASSILFHTGTFELAEGARAQGRGPMGLGTGILKVTGGDVPVQNLELVGGRLEGPGKLTATERLDWRGSRLAGILTNAGQGSIFPANQSMEADARLINQQGATLAMDNLSGQVSIFSMGEATLENRGNLNVSGEQLGVLTLQNVALNNTGMVTLRGINGLVLQGGGTSSGRFTLDGVITKLRFVSPYLLNAPTKITGSGLAFVDSGGEVTLGGDVEAEALTMNGGELIGPGTLTVTRRLTLDGGVVRGPGLIVNRGDGVVLEGGVTFDRRIFDNAGLFQIFRSFTMNNAALLRNTGRVRAGNPDLDVVIAGTPDCEISNTGTFTCVTGDILRQVKIEVPFVQRGGAVISEVGNLRFTGPYRQTGGALIARSAGVIQFDQPPQITSGSRIEGNQRILVNGGPLRNPGTAAPGQSPGTLTLEGDYIQESDGALEIELGGLVPDTEHDVFVVTGDATLGGALEILLIDGFEPQVGDTFTVMTYGSHTGEFAEVVPPCGYAFAVHYNANDVTLEVTGVGVPTPGDLDGDCDVDLDDYKRVAPCIGGPGVEVPPQGCDPDDFAAADLDLDRDVDIADVGAFCNRFDPP
ncbi:MAG: hypothetical protein C4547_04915 [Phycisphaerales bacterium]|nr:MAG: hypothetical protein C4547_04915 [Phycisphaerales bacterium]